MRAYVTLFLRVDAHAVRGRGFAAGVKIALLCLQAYKGAWNDGNIPKDRVIAYAKAWECGMH